MTSRKELKQDAVARVREAKQAAKARALEIEALPAAERAAARATDKAAVRAAQKEAKAVSKRARAAMTRPQKRLDKRAERIYRKVKNRRRRMIGWGVVGLVVVGVGVIAAPYVQDISRLLSISVDSTTAAGKEARVYGAKIAEQISDEGIVLLKNDDGALPLAQENGINVFSFASFNLRYGGGGSGGADQSSALTLYEGLADQGIKYNPDLYAAMEKAGAKTDAGPSNGLMAIVGMLTGGGKAEEPAPDYLIQEVLDQAKGFSDTAMIVLGNDGVEMSDFTVSELQITENTRALLDVVTKNFDSVIVVVNSGNQMELGFLEEYPQIKAAVSIGTPGPMGAVSLAKILSGEVNPSGHLTDTYAYDVTTAAASVNFGDYKYDNAKRSFLNYNEGIYVGYRFYETFFAGDEAGYTKAVQFPFGYGLSYTDFAWDVSEPQIVGEDIIVDVEVTNTGQVAGKNVVQAYFSAPYTPGGTEKSVIELGAFAKTGLLEPGAKETVKLTFAMRDMASWNESGAYVLDAGTYQVKVSTDVHVAGDQFLLEVDQEIVYDTDEVTGAALENRFDYARGDLTYLSRNDWEGTFPDNTNLNHTASPELLEAMKQEIAPAAGTAPTYGADNGLMLADLKGLSYDAPEWELFLDQFTLQEQNELFNRGGYQTQAIDRLGIPAAVLLDGPAGLNFFFGNVTAASFPTEVVIASTWNEQLAFDMGEAIGTEANAYGVQGWYAPGMNIHRTAQGGRNFEYYSEDPLLSGKIGMQMIVGAQSKDVLTFMKHFVLNDQETNARSGINVWVNEQALRELYLKPFEITVKEGNATGAMSSFVHVGPKWSGGNPELLQDVLRGEWGFDGVVSTDAVLGGFMNPTLAVRNGNDLMLAPLPTNNIRAINKAVKEDPVGVGNGLRDRVHAISYALLRTDLF